MRYLLLAMLLLLATPLVAAQRHEFDFCDGDGFAPEGSASIQRQVRVGPFLTQSGPGRNIIHHLVGGREEFRRCSEAQNLCLA
jgi:hypothetical protein